MDEVLELVNIYVVDPFVLGLPEPASTIPSSYARWSEDYTIMRQFAVLWTFLYISSLMIFVIFAGGSFVTFFMTNRQSDLRADRKELHTGTKANTHTTNHSYWVWDAKQIADEVWVSVWSLFFMSGMTAIVDIYFLCGGSKIYHSIDEYGWTYLLASPILFLIFTDALIYWIHRALHWPSLYWLHKLHHHYKESTPFSAFSFHPIDGFAQSSPYHIFVMIFPMHARLNLFTFFVVGLWTINIHDRMTLRLPGVNGAAHHTIHHTMFRFNYGQYFTLWDRMGGTYMDPYKMWPYVKTEAEGKGQVAEAEVTTSKDTRKDQ